MGKNKSIAEKEYKRMLLKAQQICAIRERCVSDIHLKLTQWEAPPEWIESITSVLIENNFINEERFARAYAKDKFRFSKWGKIKIQAALRQKGIAEQDIREGLDEINEEKYREVHFALLESKWKTLKGNSYEKKAKAVRFLQSRGFEYELILEAIDKISADETD